ncbi:MULTISPECIES: gliding motility-associated ABC transporter ATP-binding subunit GldA [Reichenbachiella]|uniref:gliding motility-associated ABC transporter ATP-binding subunit GldA n=1 Tax=Reichenbachiella TaxID=156993 RepID=UPI000E6BF417|nr:MULTISPECIES: gliding motility-associated ABC transporter ATP-binding subunit GldA [Reichenbachiella]MBU2914027.1 gliding motility-associated ABC transporter ATP-binding subunit GldA [Reichenbachiella agariperforans]RJE74065.1 gliding motility-associated ABC transporter ATP-binding subunit GldA [Reichenbachiella sp. MSK19-1]
MSIVVENLTKIYGQQRAVSDISFTANKGEILGFLGPNGAGKSTTMKIATGYLIPDAGQVIVAGEDIVQQTRAAQRKIGYLPEHNPLYLDMYVHEFLQFSARTYQMSKPTARIAEVIEQCGLTREQNKKLGQLSKGYRQRVGLAHALLHEPEVLILDEPTTGLDPNQILEIRKLIKEVSRDKTVIFSSHIMQEVQALCDRVVLINKGEIIANQSIADFSKGLQTEAVLRVEFKQAIDVSVLEGLDVLTKVTHQQDGHYKVHAANSEEARSAIFKLAAEQNLPLVGLQEEGDSLEDIFHQLTQES